MAILEFPRECIEYGNIKLHSGWRSNAKYDVEKAMNNTPWKTWIIGHIPFSLHYVGIETGGALMAKAAYEEFPTELSIVRNGKLIKGRKPIRPYLLIDDATTTESSLLEAINAIGSMPEKIFVAMDRRIWKRLKLTPIFRPEPAFLLF